MACPALPLCGLAVTEAERSLPDMLPRLRVPAQPPGLGGPGRAGRAHDWCAGVPVWVLETLRVLEMLSAAQPLGPAGPGRARRARDGCFVLVARGL